MSTTPEPFRYIDADEFCLSARLMPDFDTGGVTDTLSISIEGDEPQSVHVPVADLPKILAGLSAASGVQPGTRPETHVVADSSDDPEHVDDCPGCEAFSLTGHTAARPVPDTERRERWEARYRAYVNSDEDPGTGSDTGDLAVIGMAVADSEVDSVIHEAGQRISALSADLHEERTLAARRESELIGRRATVNRLRAELEQARATTLTADERQFLTFALDQAADEMSLGDGFTDEDEAALEKFRAMAAAGSGGQAEASDVEPPEHSWRVETYDDTAEYWAPGMRHTDPAEAAEYLARLNVTRPKWAVDGVPVKRRLVRATTTYTVETGGQAEDGAPVAPTREQRNCGSTTPHPTHQFMRMEAVFQCPGVGAMSEPVVAYRNGHQPGVLLCRGHGFGWAGLTPLTAADLPDGGACTFGDPGDPDDRCGRDVLIPQPNPAVEDGAQQK